MPMPTTAKWPKPKSEDEFEDMVVDFLRVRWQDPHATRHGRRGQRQDGVDVIGHPPWLKGSTAGAQCKNTDALTLATVMAEVDKAKSFKGGLSEFLIATTADRDAALQAETRQHFRVTPAPFDVEIVFWPDIVADLAGHDDLVAKHWKGFAVTASPPSSMPPPPTWFDRDGVKTDETTHCQCEFALWIPKAADLDASELATEVQGVEREGGAGPIFHSLLGQAPLRVDQRFKWALKHREYANVIRKWELEIGGGGFMAFRWGKFTTGDLSLFEMFQLLDGVTLASRIHRIAIDRAYARLATPAPARLAGRLSALSSSPLHLHDEIQVVADVGMSSAKSPESWSAEIEMDRGPTARPFVVRLVNRALANFASTGGHFGRPGLARLDEDAFSRILERVGRDV